jgi:O-antigen ligase/tetratricopeptide (TPR) repeat protein
MVALMVLSLAFFVTWMWKITQREYSILPTWMDRLVLLFLISYTIPLFLGAADQELAFIEFAKTIMFFIVFWSVSNLSYNKRIADVFIRTLYFSGAAVGVIALAGAMSIINIRDGFQGTRLFSSLQYPNTAAALFMAVFILGLYLLEKDKLRYLYLPIQMLVMLSFFATKSRGAFLVWLVVIALFYLFVPSSKRMSFLSTTLVASIPAYLIRNSFLAACANKNVSTAVLLLLATIAFTLAITWSKEKIVTMDWFGRTNGKIIISIQTVLLVLFMIEAVFGFSFVTERFASAHPTAAYATVETVVPEKESSIISTDRDMSLDTYSAYSRLYWMQEAIEEIFMEHPIFGHGGGAWEASYKSFQSYDYNTTQVHSSWVQILVETGLLGFLSFVGIWISLIIYGLRIWKKGTDEQKLLQTSLVVSAFALGGHAVIDFDFSLSCVMLFLFALFGVSRSLHNIDQKKVGRILPPAQAKKWRVPVVVLVLLLTLGSGYIGFSYKASINEAREAVEAARDNKADQGIEHFLASVKYWPLKTDYLLDLSSMYKSQKDYENAGLYLEKAEKVSPYDAKVYEAQMTLAWLESDYLLVMEKAESAVNAAPFNKKYRAMQSEMLILTGLRLVQETVSSDVDYRPTIQEYLIAAKDYPEKFEEMNRIRQNLIDSTSLKIDPVTIPITVINNAGAAAYLLGDFEEADVLLQDAINRNIANGVTYFWLTLVESHKGDNTASQKYLAMMLDAEKENNFNEDTIDRYRSLPEFWEADLEA